MRILRVDEPVRNKPCKKQREKFLQLFGPEVEVTPELCRRYRRVFHPWAAVAWLYLSSEGYYAWFDRWPITGQYLLPAEAWDQYLSDSSAAFAIAFNNEGALDGTSSTGQSAESGNIP